jgi:hypothetical protein
LNLTVVVLFAPNQMAAPDIKKPEEVKSIRERLYKIGERGKGLAVYKPMVLTEDGYDFIHQMLCSMGTGAWTLRSLKAMWRRDIRASMKEAKTSTWNSFKQQTLTDMMHWMRHFDETFVALVNDGFIVHEPDATKACF